MRIIENLIWELSLAWTTAVKSQLEGLKKLVVQADVVVKQVEVVLLRGWITRLALWSAKDPKH